MERRRLSPGLRLSIVYVLIAAVWIIASDRLVALLVSDPDTRDVVQSAKGLFYILLTASLLYWFARREFRNSEAANRALAESEAKWRSLVENAPDFILTVDRQGNILFINHASEDLSLNDASHNQVYHYIAPENHEMVRDAITYVFETGQPTSHELKALGPDGVQTWYSSMLGPIKRNGEVTSVIVITRDITERKQAEMALTRELSIGRALSALYRPLVSPYSSIEQIADTVFQQAKQLTSSEHGFVSAIDPATGDNVGYTLSTMFGEECGLPASQQRLVFSPNEDGTYPGLWGHSLNTGEAFFTNAPDTHPAFTGVPEGHVPLRRFLSVPVFLGDELVGQIALANAPRDYDGHDLDALQRLGEVYALAIQRKRAEDALRASEVKYRSIFDHANDAIFLHTLPGRFIDVNQIACERLGYTRDELLAMSPEDIDDPRYSGEIPGRLRTIAEQGSWVFETAHVHRDGRSIPVEINTRVIDYDGQPVMLSIARDISERKQAEAALYEANQALEALIQASPLPIFVIDPEGKVQVMWNQAAERVFGWRAEEVMGRPLPFVIEENQPQFRGFVDRILRGESLVDVQATRHRRDGTPVDVSISTAPLRDAEGNITGIMSVLADITERKRIERAEREQRALAEALADIATTLNKTLDINEVLDHILENTGRVVPHDIANIMLIDEGGVTIVRHKGYTERGMANPVESQHFRIEDFETFRTMIRTREPVVVPDTAESPTWRNIDGPSWQQSYIGVPIQVRGEVIGFLNLSSETPGFYSALHAQRLQAFADQAAVALENARLYDETRRYADELETRVQERTAELNHSKERIEAILNSSSDVIILVGRDGMVEQVNTTFDRIFQCPPDEVVDQHLTGLVHADDADRVTEMLANVVETHQPQRLELTMYCHQRVIFDADMMMSPILERDDRLLGVVCSVRDITTRKHMEAQLRQMLEHEMELSELKSHYVSMAAHDLRTPLAVIQSSADLLSNYADRMSEVQRETTFKRLRAGISQMVDLLDDILTIGRVEAGKIRFEPEWVNLEAFCREIVREFQQLPTLEHEVTYSSTGDCTEVFLDPKLVRYVLNNLLSNAIKYSPPGTTVSLDVVCTGDTCTLRVRDRGIGIPAEDRDRIFEAFHRADNVGTTPGTGLGLAIVKQSVELHGGSITLESEEGAGTTVTVTLPQIQ